MSKIKFLLSSVVIFLLSFQVVLAQSCFTDTAGHPFEDAICGIKEMGVVEGYADGSYKPANYINRAEFTKIIISIKPELHMGVEPGFSPFSDVTDSDWFYPHVIVAEEFGIIGGYPDGTFRPGNNINLAEALKIMLETFDVEVTETGGAWYEKYINAALLLGIIEGDDIDPGVLITRGDMAQMVFLLAYYSLGYADTEDCIDDSCEEVIEDTPDTTEEDEISPVDEETDVPVGNAPIIPGFEGVNYAERVCEGQSSVVSPCENEFYMPCSSENDYYAFDKYGEAWTYGMTCEWGLYNTEYDPCVDLDGACLYDGITEVVDYDYGYWILENAVWTLRGYFAKPGA